MDTTTEPQGTAFASSDAGMTADQQSKSLKDAATGVADEAGRTVEKTAAKGMTQVSDTLRQVAGAVRQSGEQLQSEQPQIAGFVSTAADRLEEAATYVSEHEPRELIDTAQDLARRQPALVVGGGLVVGLLLGRVLRSAGGPSSAGQGGQGSQDWYGSGYVGGTSGTRLPSGASSGFGTGFGADYDRSTGPMTGTSIYASNQATGSPLARSNGGSSSGTDLVEG